MKQHLLDHIVSIANPQLRETCEAILHYPKFSTCPASLSFHHAYEGGLLVHTVEICDIVIVSAAGLSNGLNQGVDYDTLVAAALWHDVMKMEEYEPSETAAVSGIMWRHTDAYGKRIGHICGSALQFQCTATHFGVERKTIDTVVHCILAHHGRKEWGSPVEPQTLEALILHQADMLSAKFGATKEVAP